MCSSKIRPAQCKIWRVVLQHTVSIWEQIKSTLALAFLNNLWLVPSSINCFPWLECFAAISFFFSTQHLSVKRLQKEWGEPVVPHAGSNTLHKRAWWSKVVCVKVHVEHSDCVGLYLLKMPGSLWSRHTGFTLSTLCFSSAIVLFVVSLPPNKWREWVPLL